MVLDSKAMEWASQQGLDTAALKKAKVPIFGKWYFPELPEGVPLVNLQTGEVETFGRGFRAGAILYVKEEDLKRAKLGPYAASETPAEQPPAAGDGAREQAPVSTEDRETQASGVTGRPVAPAHGPEPAQVAASLNQPDAEDPATEERLTSRRQAEPSAVPTQASIGEQEPVRMLHDDPDAAVGQTVGAHGGHDGHAAEGEEEHVGYPAVAEQAHPQPRTYITIALILAVITAIEVAVYYIPALLQFIVPILLVLSAAKFALVVGYFMHLKFDHKIYTGLFAAGLAIAISVFVGVVLMFVQTPPGGGH